MGFFDGLMGNASEMDNDKLEKELKKIIVEEENIKAAIIF